MASALIKRIYLLVLRRHRARGLGIKFNRAASFTLPPNIVIHQNRFALHAPSKGGIPASFIDIFLDDCYGLRNLHPPVHKILDVGANVGFFSLAAKSLFPEAEIHAYEPNPEMEKYLKQNSVNGSFNYFMEAVGCEDGKVSLDFYEDIVSTRSCNDQTGVISRTAFKRIVERMGGSIDLLKMDCEGAEWEIFRDTDSFQKVRQITMEYHLWPNRTHEEICRTIQNLGFQVQSQKKTHPEYGLLTTGRKKIS